jgi:hypothetical protein
MITFENLSKRICQFFDEIYASNKSQFGFSSVGDESFKEERIDQNERPSYDFSSTNFISSDLDLAKWKTALVGSRTIDAYIRTILGKTIAQIPTMTMNELLTALNSILLIDDFYANINVENFVLTKQITELLKEAQTGFLTNITAIRRLNKMLLCSIYSTQILTSATYLTPINISTILYFRIEDTILGEDIQTASKSLDSSNLEVLEANKQVIVVMNVLSKQYKAKDAVNFFNFAIQSDNRIDSACYNSEFEFDLILTSKTKPIVLTELEKGAWLERIEQTLTFKYTDRLSLDETDLLHPVASIYEVKDIIQYDLETKQGD